MNAIDQVLWQSRIHHGLHKQPGHLDQCTQCPYNIGSKISKKWGSGLCFNHDRWRETNKYRTLRHSIRHRDSVLVHWKFMGKIEHKQVKIAAGVEMINQHFCSRKYRRSKKGESYIITYTAPERLSIYLRVLHAWYLE